jgi:hypothetical protein
MMTPPRNVRRDFTRLDQPVADVVSVGC